MNQFTLELEGLSVKDACTEKRSSSTKKSGNFFHSRSGYMVSNEETLSIDNALINRTGSPPPLLLPSFKFATQKVGNVCMSAHLPSVFNIISFCRFMVATRDIEPLEMILWEKPAVIGPYTKDAAGCLQCFKQMTTQRACSQCGLPVCSPKCEQGRLHQEECLFIQKKNLRFPGDENIIQTQNATQPCITPLRMLLKRKTDPKTFARIDMLMDHATSKNGKGALNMTMLKVVCMIREQFQCSDFTKTDIQRMIGILKTNGMKLETSGENGTPGVALYPIYCLINHACINNTNYVKYPDLHLELRSQLPIKKGTEIFTRYISSTIGNPN